MLTALVFVYYSQFPLRAVRLALLACVAVFGCCALTIMASLKSALSSTLSGLQESFPDVVDLALEFVLFSTPFGVQ